jgi:general secretion pathway protein G
MEGTMSFFRSRQLGITSEKDTYGLNKTIDLRVRANGFTLIELIIVIAILGTLMGIAMPLYASYMDKANVAKAIAEMKSIEIEIFAFNSDNGRYPSSLAEIGLGSFMDPYGNPYQYMPAPSEDKGAEKAKMRKDRNLHPVNTDFDLYSMGKDGKSSAPFTAQASQDDIVRANDGGFFGLVSAY